LSNEGVTLNPISFLCQNDKQTPGVINLNLLKIGKEEKSSTPENATEQIDEDELTLDYENEAAEYTVRVTSLESTVRQFSLELQHLAETGIATFNRRERDNIKVSASSFEKLGLKLLAANIDKLADANKEKAALLLRVRYLCQLCREMV